MRGDTLYRVDLRDWVLRRKQWKAIPLLSAVFWGALKKASLWAYAVVKAGGDLDFLGLWAPLWGFVKEWDWVIVPAVGIFGLWWIGRKKPGTSPSEKQNSPTISPDVITTTPISVRNVPRANNAPLILKLGEEILKFHRERREQEDGWWQDTARSLSGRSIYSQETSSVFLEIFADRVGRAVKQLKVKGRAVDDIDYNYEDRRNFTVEQIYKIGFRLRVLGC